jgi:hypothetical protein
MVDVRVRQPDRLEREPQPPGSMTAARRVVSHHTMEQFC